MSYSPNFGLFIDFWTAETLVAWLWRQHVNEQIHTDHRRKFDAVWCVPPSKFVIFAGGVQRRLVGDDWFAQIWEFKLTNTHCVDLIVIMCVFFFFVEMFGLFVWALVSTSLPGDWLVVSDWALPQMPHTACWKHAATSCAAIFVICCYGWEDRYRRSIQATIFLGL